MHNRARHAHESTPLVRRDTDTDDAATRTRWVKYGVLVSLLGVLLVAGSARVAWETPKSADLGEYPLGFTSTMATARVNHRATRAGSLGEDTASVSDVDTSGVEATALEQVPDLVQQVKDLTEENSGLEEDVAALHAEIVATRDMFLKVGHGGSSNHLAGSLEDEVIAALENQNKDIFYELQKTKKRKYELYLSLLDADKTVAACDVKMADAVLQKETAIATQNECLTNADTNAAQVTDLEKQVEMLIADLKARDDAVPPPFDFFCAGENEQCKCGHGDIVYAALRQDDGTVLDLMTILASKEHVFVNGTDDYVCSNDLFQTDPAVGEEKGCFCAPKGLNSALNSGSQAVVTDAATDEEATVDATDYDADTSEAIEATDTTDNTGATDTPADYNGTIDTTDTSADYSQSPASPQPTTTSSGTDANVPSSEFYAESEQNANEVAEQLTFEENQAHENSCSKFCSEENIMDSQCMEHCLAVFHLCGQSCAAKNECCNNDFERGSNQKLSCLQSCIVRVSMLTSDECNAQCETNACERDIYGVKLPSCNTCDDVPAHAEHFGDDFNPAEYECAARWGTDQNSCETGCRVGGDLLDKYGHDYDYHSGNYHGRDDASDAAASEPNSPPAPEAPNSPPAPEPVSEVTYCGDSGGFSSGPKCVCPAGNIIYAQNNLESLDAAVIMGRFVKKHYNLTADSWSNCFNNGEFSDPAPGQPKGCWCVPSHWEPVHPPPSPHPPPRPPHPYPPPGEHPNFASIEDLKAAVASCLSVGDGSGKECCSKHGADCGVAGHADMPDWNVGGITDMSGLFKDKNMFNEDLSTWDVSSVENMGNMFSSAEAFNQPLDSWDVSSVTTISHMFGGTKAFNQDLNSWVTSKLENMAHCFNGAKVFNGDISSWDVKEVTNMNGVFWSAEKFNQDLSAWEPGKVTTMYAMFHKALSFDQDITGWSTPLATNVAHMFTWSPAFTSKFRSDNCGSNGPASCWHVPLPPTPPAPSPPPPLLPISEVRYCSDHNRAPTPDCVCPGGSVISAANKLESLDAAVLLGLYQRKDFALDFTGPWDQCFNGGWFTDAAPNYPKGCWCVPTDWEPVNPPPSPSPPPPPPHPHPPPRPPHPYPPPGEHPNFASIDDLRAAVTSCLSVGDGSGKECCSRHGADCGTAGHADMPDWNVGGITDMSKLFQNAVMFNENLSDWDVSSIEDMSEMFRGASAFNMPLENWDTSSVLNMGSMFWEASAFNQDLNAWDTSQVSNFERTFMFAKSFNGDISEWDVRSALNMQSMLEGAEKFNQDLSGWDVSSVTMMRAMFHKAIAFDGDISGWSTPEGANVDHMFKPPCTAFLAKFTRSDGGHMWNGPASVWHVPSPPPMPSPPPPLPSPPPPTPSPPPPLVAVSEVTYCGDETQGTGPQCVCPGGSIYFASRSYDSLDDAVSAGKFVKNDYALHSDDSWTNCYVNDEFPDPAPGEGKGCWCVPSGLFFHQDRFSSSATYEYLEREGTCEDFGMQTILEKEECRIAGAFVDGSPDKPVTENPSIRDRPRGCVIHPWSRAENGYPDRATELFSGATQKCTATGYTCICKQNVSDDDVTPTPTPTGTPTSTPTAEPTPVDTLTAEWREQQYGSPTPTATHSHHHDYDYDYDYDYHHHHNDYDYDYDYSRDYSHVPSNWVCPKDYYSTHDGCDCDCGAWDPDCDDSSAEVHNCDGLGGSPTCVKTNGRGTCKSNVPSEWHCNAAYYGTNDGCDCECGAWDPDCDDAHAEVHNCDGFANPTCVNKNGGTCEAPGGGSDLEVCQAKCAAEHECCNVATSQGANQNLSCLQACMVVKSGVSKDTCLGYCDTRTCGYNINGVYYGACGSCDDVPKHGNKAPVDYTCTSGFGTNSNSCKNGCAAGAA